ncbi:MAG TPA: O-acetyl-ADP-ribose deacetylase [Candidatus Omnitrophota bacterium]|nr:O-acetyl-ADP-ribose deacetylase [Candidatus Omnitrophota bacterium]HQQ05525.1 O-acetyl-ADP-ribose deacetylase [Candidatus Omnitrophota bacterium]
MTKIECALGDITTVRVDAIVNAANTTLLGGFGVDGAIHGAAGPQLLAECRTLGGCETGNAKITRGYGLPAKFVIHAVGPVWRGGKHGEDRLLADAYGNSLRLAVEHGIQSIAFPAISTGAYRFPFDSAASIALSTTKDFIERNPAALERVIFISFSDRDHQAYLRLCKQYFPSSC